MVVESPPVVIGKVSGVFGIKGWLKIHSFTEPGPNILDYQPLLMQRDDGWEAIEIDQSRQHGKGLVVHLVGCDDRDQAQLLVRRELACDASRLPALQGQDYYWRDLEGLDVYVQQESAQLLLGRIDHLFATGANDVMVVRATEQSVDSRERLLPWMLEKYVLEVDLKNGRIVVDWDPDF